MTANVHKTYEVTLEEGHYPVKVRADGARVHEGDLHLFRDEEQSIAIFAQGTWSHLVETVAEEETAP